MESLNDSTHGPAWRLSRRSLMLAGSIGLLRARLASAAAGELLPPPSTARKLSKSLIIIWLDGGPSQLETFDPHPGGAIGGPTKAIPTAIKDVDFADGLPRLAEQAGSLTIVRSMVCKEGDHERGRYLMKTGAPPNPTVTHPAIGSICAALTPTEGLQIPRYISISTSGKIPRGGYLGEAFDPVRLGDPAAPLANVRPPVSPERQERRLQGLRTVEQSLLRRHPALAIERRRREELERALGVMASPQLKAFDLAEETMATRAEYGDEPFGRGCLLARRLVEAGVPAVDVELGGWDLHANNFDGCASLRPLLDRALATLLTDLKRRGLWESTLVVVMGEFGRTPKINGLGGRDHWTNGFSVALAGSRIRPGIVHGATDPQGKKDPVHPVRVDDLFATLLSALEIDPAREHLTTAGRPIKLSDGKPIAPLLQLE